MFEAAVNMFVGVLALYALVGLLFAIVFVGYGVQRIDTQARGAGLGFRLLILPGVAAFWPMFLSRWARGVPDPPIEKTPHRSLHTLRGL